MPGDLRARQGRDLSYSYEIRVKVKGSDSLTLAERTCHDYAESGCERCDLRSW